MSSDQKNPGYLLLNMGWNFLPKYMGIISEAMKFQDPLIKQPVFNGKY